MRLSRLPRNLRIQLIDLGRSMRTLRAMVFVCFEGITISLINGILLSILRVLWMHVWCLFRHVYGLCFFVEMVQRVEGFVIVFVVFGSLVFFSFFFVYWWFLAFKRSDINLRHVPTTNGAWPGTEVELLLLVFDFQEELVCVFDLLLDFFILSVISLIVWIQLFPFKTLYIWWRLPLTLAYKNVLLVNILIGGRTYLLWLSLECLWFIDRNGARCRNYCAMRTRCFLGRGLLVAH